MVTFMDFYITLKHEINNSLVSVHVCSNNFAHANKYNRKSFKTIYWIIIFLNTITLI